MDPVRDSGPRLQSCLDPSLLCSLGWLLWSSRELTQILKPFHVQYDAGYLETFQHVSGTRHAQMTTSTCGSHMHTQTPVPSHTQLTCVHTCTHTHSSNTARTIHSAHIDKYALIHTHRPHTGHTYTLVYTLSSHSAHTHTHVYIQLTDTHAHTQMCPHTQLTCTHTRVLITQLKYCTHNSRCAHRQTCIHTQSSHGTHAHRCTHSAHTVHTHTHAHTYTQLTHATPTCAHTHSSHVCTHVHSNIIQTLHT